MVGYRLTAHSTQFTINFLPITLPDMTDLKNSFKAGADPKGGPRGHGPPKPWMKN